MSEVIRESPRTRERTWHTCKAVAEVAAHENRSFTPAEESEWRVLYGDLDAFDERIGTAYRAGAAREGPERRDGRVREPTEGPCGQQPAGGDTGIPGLHPGGAAFPSGRLLRGEPRTACRVGDHDVGCTAGVG